MKNIKVNNNLIEKMGDLITEALKESGIGPEVSARWRNTTKNTSDNEFQYFKNMWHRILQTGAYLEIKTDKNVCYWNLEEVNFELTDVVEIMYWSKAEVLEKIGGVMNPDWLSNAKNFCVQSEQ